ncbi:MAG: Rrf2 family transcriptional regulator [Candidatus Dadabacteria bacterium]
MKMDTRLSSLLHVLLHMAVTERPVTSEALAKMMRTNPVVVRRTLAGLREDGLVSSEKGHGGGWRISCDKNKVTLYDIYTALGNPTILAIGNRSESPDCLIEKAVNSAMSESYREAEDLLLERFREVTLAELSKHMYRHLKEHKERKNV